MINRYILNIKKSYLCYYIKKYENDFNRYMRFNTL
jgi:hypothetical protein